MNAFILGPLYLSDICYSVTVFKAKIFFLLNVKEISGCIEFDGYDLQLQNGHVEV